MIHLGEKVNQLVQLLQDGVSEVFSSEKYPKYLEAIAQFRGYSYNNIMLINIQCPGATLVMGLRQWNKFNRKVKKGEKAIGIIAPMKYKNYNKQSSDEPDELLTFRVVNVFDISQTEGDDIPGVPKPLYGDTEYFSAFADAASKKIGKPLIIKELPIYLDGYYNTETGEFAVNSLASKKQQALAIIHEWAHHEFMEHDKANAVGKSLAEVEAEGTAYVVCKYFDIETSDNSFNYIATWSKGKDGAELRSCAQNICSTANLMIDLIEAELANNNAQPA